MLNPRGDAHCIVTNPSVYKLRIIGNTIYDCSGDGLQTFATDGTSKTSASNDILIEGNTFYSTLKSNAENALDFKDGSNIVVRRNTIYGFTSNKAVVFQKYHNDVVFEDNIIYDSDRGVEFRGEPVGVIQTNIKVRRNVVYNINFTSFGYALKFDGIKDLDVYHNTIVNSPHKSIMVDVAGVDGGNIKNNLVYNSGAARRGSSGSAFRNVSYSNNGWFNSPADFLSGLNDVIGSGPRFVSDNDYRLMPSSPAIDKGADVGYAYTGAAPDLGAYEFGAAASPPSLAIASPANGASIIGSIVGVVYTKSGDLTGVGHVHLQLDSNSEVRDLDFDGSYQFTNVPAGQHTIKGYMARADHSKISGTDASVTFTASSGMADTAPPTVLITFPASGATVSGTIIIRATASDNAAVAGVQFKVDGTDLGPEDTASPYSASLDTATLTNGQHTLTAVARDTAGLTASSSTSITVECDDGHCRLKIRIPSITSSTNSAVIKWLTSLPATSRLEYGTTAAHGQVIQDATLKTNHSITLANLSTDTRYHFRINSTDINGNSRTFERSFETFPASGPRDYNELILNGRIIKSSSQSPCVNCTITVSFNNAAATATTDDAGYFSASLAVQISRGSSTVMTMTVSDGTATQVYRRRLRLIDDDD